MIFRFFRWLVEPFFPRGNDPNPVPAKPKEIPTKVEFRNSGSQAAIIFVHGFGGDTRATWSGLIDHILNEPQISTWDVYGIGFASSLRIDVPEVWASDPELTLIARSISTTLSLEPFKSYDALAIAAHSMGGLAIQRAVLDDPTLTSRVSNLFLFGTPSAGLPKARLVRKLKRQFRDMSPDSDFIKTLRADWNDKFKDGTPFVLRVVAGERDDFVPSSSSLKPFQTAVQAAVPGNHLEIVKPISATHQSVRIVIESLMGGNRTLPPIDSARLAVELGQFRRAVDVLLPQADQLDDNALVSLALALESVGRGTEALTILETFFKGGTSSTDAVGTLAGRLKRRWLAAGAAIDYRRALELYETGLREAEAQGDFDQAFYHTINVAFLKVMHLPPFSAVTAECEEAARRALVHCEACRITQWRLATEGEAHLILGKLEIGVNFYAKAIAMTETQREMDSMYSQALRIAERMFGEEGLLQIERTFGVHQ
jgi:pimeloyl-ACP methyl ester carboxylesterase